MEPNSSAAQHTFKPAQALVVASGRTRQKGYLSSVLTLLPGSQGWALLTSLKARCKAQASIVGGRIRVHGGHDDRSSFISEVMGLMMNYDGFKCQLCAVHTIFLFLLFVFFVFLHITRFYC